MDNKTKLAETLLAVEAVVPGSVDRLLSALSATEPAKELPLEIQNDKIARARAKRERKATRLRKEIREKSEEGETEENTNT
jgi:hypothetical protein